MNYSLLEFLKEGSHFDVKLNEVDFQFIQFLQEELSFFEIAATKRLTKERVRQIVKRITRKIPLDINSLANFYMELCIRKIKLDERELRIKNIEYTLNLNKKKTEIANLYPTEFYKPIMEFLRKDLVLSARTYNCILDAMIISQEIETFADFLKYYPTNANLKGLRNMGRKSLTELTFKLNKLGMNTDKYDVLNLI